ncbi:hypothetical protein AVEN_195592-1, partial [Araneus ventricosus]
MSGMTLASPHHVRVTTLAAGWNRRPLGPEPNILTSRQKEFPMSKGGYWLIYIRVR